MTDLLFARGQMAMSLGFHIVFAAIGVAMPVLMVIAEILWRRTGDDEYLHLTKAWAKGTAVLFAVGAVSGTVLSFELGLLFPGFMKHAGPIIGMPFSLEGFAFFVEAIFLGIYLYGWDKISARAHIASGIVVAVSGLLSAAFVLIANAWMNAPTGFTIDANGTITDIDPIKAMTSKFVFHEISHMALAAYLATGLAAAGIHAFVLLRRPDSTFHKKALGITLAMLVPAAFAQPLTGHFAGHVVAENQPMKLAAMEGQYHTQAHAPARIGGIPDEDAETVRWDIEIPGGLSFMAFGDTDAVVQGLDEFPRADWPSPIIHYAFQIMVGVGTAVAGLAAWIVIAWLRRRRKLPDARLLLLAIVAAAPLGFVAIEAGWVITEVGRQPWIIYGVLRTADAVTPMPGLYAPFVGFTLIYLGLAAAVATILVRQVKKT